MPTGSRNYNGFPLFPRGRLHVWLFPVLVANAVGARYFASLMSSTYETLARVLRTLRTERKLVQEDVARGTKIPPATISDFENAQNKGPSTDRLVALADFYNVSIDFLLGRTECRRMPAYGLWLIDKNEERNPSSAKSDWAIEFPASFEIVSGDEFKDRNAAVLQRWRSKKGKGNASPEG